MISRMTVTAYMLLENLANSLYENIGQCLMELVRNGLMASMPDPNKWEPSRGKIEITLVRNHALSRGKALVVLDRGCGLTDPALSRYFDYLGPRIGDTRSANGAAQKGIGRLAALALNRNCTSDEPISERVKHGYYILSRTAPAGLVRFISVIPEQMERDGGFELDRFISPDSTEMGNLKGIEGSFTAIIIPTPVFEKDDDIYEAIKWHLPRDRDKMFSLLIGGKPIEPPALQTTLHITSDDGSFRARLGLDDAKTPKTGGGLWLCDEETGFRVASCERMARFLPAPLGYPEFMGDIFGPNLLQYQNVPRSGLAKEATRQKSWKTLHGFLKTQVAPSAMQLIEKDLISGDAAAMLDDVVEVFNSHYGELPEETCGVTPTKPRDPKGKVVPDEKREPRQKSDSPAYRRHVSINIRGERYVLYRGQSLDPYVFAQSNPNNDKQVLVNVRGGYRALPTVKAERREHVLMQVLVAVGLTKFQNDPYQAVRYANEVRSELMRK